MKLEVQCKAPAKVNLVLRVIGTRPDGYHLIESLAGKIADEILAQYRKVKAVTVRVQKETPVLAGIVDYVGVSVSRRRAAARRTGKRAR